MTREGKAKNILLIGLGGIGRVVLSELPKGGSGARIGWLLVRPPRREEAARLATPTARIVAGLDELGGDRPDLAVECAGHGAVRAYGPALLARGTDLLVISIGALTDEALRRDLGAAAEAGGSRILLPAGAIAGIDALAAARLAGLERVIYTSRKPPLAWKGTPAEAIVDLDRISAPTVLYEGPAGEAARRYPQNANVAATVALVGLGFERTSARLIADPTAAGNIHEVEAEGAFGSFSIRLRGKPLPDNPKTSALTAYSVVRAIENRYGFWQI